MNIRKIIMEEVNDLKWIGDVKPIQIGGMVIRVRTANDGEIPIDYVGFGDKVRTRPTTAYPEGFVFTVEDMMEKDGRVGLWGSDIPENKKWHRGGKNYQYTQALVRA